MKNIINFIKIILISLIVFLLFNYFRNIDFRVLKNLISKANYAYLGLGVLITALGIVLKGKRLQILIGEFGIEKSLLDFTKIQLFSIFLANLTPGRVGEFSKIYFIAKDHQDKTFSVTIVCLFERILDFLVLCLIGGLFSFLILKSDNIMLMIAGLLIFILLFTIFILKINVILQYIPEKFKKHIVFFSKNKSKLFQKSHIVIFMTLVIWFMDASFQWVILKSINIEQPILLILGINSIVTISAIFSLLPLGLGTMELTATFLYKKVLKISEESILYLLLMARIFGISTILLMMFPTLLNKEKFKEFSNAKNAKLPETK